MKSLFTFTILAIFLFITIAQAQYGGGTGEPNNPYLIYTAEHLNAIGMEPNDWDKHFKLMADIDLSGFDGKDSRPVFKMIAPDTDPSESGYQGNPFSGVFDGDGHTISHLTVKEGVYVGLFCHVAPEAQIRDIGLIDLVIDDGHLVGGLVAWNEGNIADCHSIGTVSGSGWASLVGGLVGWNQSGKIINCYSTGVVNGEWNVGGLVGDNEGVMINCFSTSTVSSTESHGAGGLVGRNGRQGILTQCNATGDVSGSNSVGGLIGFSAGMVTACYSTGQVNGTSQHAGGLVGANGGLVIHSYSTGVVSGRYDVGGLVGVNYRTNIGSYFGFSSGDIINCFSIGSVRGNEYIGGLVGSNIGHVVIGCYSSGEVSGDKHTGGLIGSGREVIACFWDIESSGQTLSAGGEGKTTSQMHSAGIFLEAGWDFIDETANGFEDIWKIDEGRNYPKLVHRLSAFSPYPHDNATDITQPLMLYWAAGSSAVQHDVYFGEDAQVVANATVESPSVYRGRKPIEITTYDPGILKLEKTYYWRIDEVNQPDPNSPWKSHVRNFTTANFIVVDDFESYDALGNQIWRSWHDGYGYGVIRTSDFFAGNGTGSVVGEMDWIEETIVHGGQRSMPYEYYNNRPDRSKYSEASLTLIYPRNWTQDGVSELSLWFRGNNENDYEPIYVAISNAIGQTAVVNHEDPNAVRINIWAEWKIDLNLFADQGVDLTEVDVISIGFGDRNYPQPGGSGKMYFDDIRLYRPRLTASDAFEVIVP